MGNTGGYEGPRYQDPAQYHPTDQPQNRPARKGLYWTLGIIGLIVGMLLCFGACSVFFGAADEAAKQAGLADGIATAEAQENPDADLAEPPQQNVTAKVGETLTVTGDATEKWTLAKTELAARDEYGSKAEKGTYLLLSMKVTVSEGSTYICGCSLQLVGPDNTVYDPTYATIKNRPDLPATSVGNGQKVAGWVIFDVPNTALKDGRIQLRPNAFQDVYGYWAL
jgi:hypothetical protein